MRAGRVPVAFDLPVRRLGVTLPARRFSDRLPPLAAEVLPRARGLQLSMGWRSQLPFRRPWAPPEVVPVGLVAPPLCPCFACKSQRHRARWPKPRPDHEPGKLPTNLAPLVEPPGQRLIILNRKCNPFEPRARSISAKRLTMREREDGAALLRVLQRSARPHTRADCEAGPRPCPWVSCRYNLYLDVSDKGSIKLNFPDREPHEMPPTGSCVLDIADRVHAGDQLSLEEVGKLMNLGIERVRQISAIALQEARIVTMREERFVKVRVPEAARGPRWQR